MSNHQYDFSLLLCEAWSNTMVLSNILSRFKRSGIYPFNPKTLNYATNGNSSANGGSNANDNSSVNGGNANGSSSVKGSTTVNGSSACLPARPPTCFPPASLPACLPMHSHKAGDSARSLFYATITNYQWHVL